MPFPLSFVGLLYYYFLRVKIVMRTCNPNGLGLQPWALPSTILMEAHVGAGAAAAEMAGFQSIPMLLGRPDNLTAFDDVDSEAPGLRTCFCFPTLLST